MKTFDNLISSFDFDKFQSDCIIHDFMKTYIKKKSVSPGSSLTVPCAMRRILRN